MTEYETFPEDWEEPDDYAYGMRTGKGPLGAFNQNISTNTITTKVPPMFDGTQSWFAYETAIDEWVDPTEFAEDKQGLALKARLEGEPAPFKEFLERDMLKQTRGHGVAYFKETLRNHFLKSSSIVFLSRFLKFF